MGSNLINDPIAALLGNWSYGLNAGSIIFRIAMSVLLSAVIGCERASKRHAAGLRTFIAVSLSCTAAMLTDIWLISAFGVRSALISAASVIAVAILSSNSVLFSSKSRIKGLTTSAGLWGCGIIGLSLGAGLYTVTAVAFVSLICSLSIFPTIEVFLKNRSNHFEIHLELKSSAYLQNFVTTIRQLGLRIDDIEANPAYSASGLSVYSVAVSIKSEELKKYKRHSEIISALKSLDYICHIEEMG